MNNKKEKGITDYSSNKSDGNVEGLQLGLIGINFKDKRGAQVECIYDPTKVIRQIARGLYSLRNPPPDAHGSVAHDLTYESKRPTKTDIATIAYSIWST